MNHVYCKKPVQVEAFQMTMERMSNNIDWPHWLHKAWCCDAGLVNSLSIHSYDPRDNTPLRYELCTSSGNAVVYQGDWIIKGVMGELYPCDDAVFKATYDVAGEPVPTGTEGVVAANPERHLTFGEKAVGLTFNPSNDPAVYQCKAHFAALIDQLHELRGKGGVSDQPRLASIAITELQGAQMWAVKALTWKD